MANSAHFEFELIDNFMQDSFYSSADIYAHSHFTLLSLTNWIYIFLCSNVQDTSSWYMYTLY